MTCLLLAPLSLDVPSHRCALLVAQVELRRTWRNLTRTKRGILLLVGGALVLPLYGVGLGAGAYFFGLALPGVSPAIGRTIFGVTLVSLAGLVVVAVLQRTIKRTGEPDCADGLLTTLPSQDVLAGVFLAEWVRITAIAALPAFGVVAGFTAGSGSLRTGAVVLVLMGAMVTVGLEVGYALGLVAKYVAGRSEFVARRRATIGIVLSVGIPLTYVLLVALPSAQLAAVQVFSASPVGWLGDVVYVAVPGERGRPLRAGATVAVLVSTLVALAVVNRVLVERVWFMDRVEPPHEFDPRSRGLSDRLLAGTVPDTTLVVAQKSWRRARRAPFTVQFAVFPFFLLIFHVYGAIVEQRIPPSLPLLVALASATAGGAAFSLNPLGGEGPVLPMTLTGTISGRQFIAGLGVAGALPGTLLALALSVPLGIAAGLSSLAIGAIALTALLAGAGAPAVAAGVGVIFPRFETSTVSDHEVVVPSTWAFAGYVLLLGVALLPVLLTQVPTFLSVVAGVVPLTPSLLPWAGILATGLLLTVFGGLSAGIGAWRVGQYQLP